MINLLQHGLFSQRQALRAFADRLGGAGFGEWPAPHHQGD